MSLSLREQLLKAGLVTEKQAKKAERQTSQQQHQRKTVSYTHLTLPTTILV